MHRVLLPRCDWQSIRGDHTHPHGGAKMIECLLPISSRQKHPQQTCYTHTHTHTQFYVPHTQKLYDFECNAFVDGMKICLVSFVLHTFYFAYFNSSICMARKVILLRYVGQTKGHTWFRATYFSLDIPIRSYCAFAIHTAKTERAPDGSTMQGRCSDCAL